MSLQRALLLSIALHALLCFSLPERQPMAQKASDPLLLVARLMQPAVVQAPVEAQRPVTKPALASRRVAPIARPAELTAESVPRSTPSEEPRANESQHQAKIEGIPEPAPETAVSPPSPQLDPGEVAKYRLEVISAAKQFKRYPPLARENNWEGRAEVRLSFEGARQPTVAIHKSSGYAILDRQALETMSKALAPLPPPLLGRSFELDFPVIFSLED